MSYESFSTIVYICSVNSTSLMGQLPGSPPDFMPNLLRPLPDFPSSPPAETFPLRQDRSPPPA